MKWHFCVKRPIEGQKDNEIVIMAKTLIKGGVVRWGRFSQVKAFTEPLHKDGTPAVELGYINMLVEGPVISYIRDKMKFSKVTIITKGWPKNDEGV